MRPVLDHRMPTLAGSSAFLMPLTGVSGLQRKKSAIQQLEATPARSLKHVRQLLTMEIKSVLRRITRLEGAYYGEQKTIYNDVEKNIYPIKSVMKSVHIFECNSTSMVEEILKKTTVNNYKGSEENIKVLKDLLAKVRLYFPDKMNELISACYKLLDMLNKYCSSFYNMDPDKEGYLETSANYEEQIHSWRKSIESSLNSANEVFRRLKGRGVSVSNLTPPVENFVYKYNVQKVLLLVIFADACTNLRNAVSLMTSWIKTDETYSGFLKNDLGDLEALKHEKIRELREAQSKYHSLTFRKTQLEIDCAKMRDKRESLEERRTHLKEEDSVLTMQVDELEYDIEVKACRMEGYKNVDLSNELCVETFELLGEDLKEVQQRLAGLQKQLDAVRHKLRWVEDKVTEFKRTSKGIKRLVREMVKADEERRKKEKAFEDVEKSLKLARKIILCKTSNDAVEKLFYSIPVHARHTKTSGSATKTYGPLDKACRVISRTIERDWAHLYRELPFFPTRGSENIERDISSLSTTGARETLITIARRALERWKRHHTRAMVDDLKIALRKVKRPDVIRAIEEELKPPARMVDDGDPDDKLPPVPPELLEFYELGEKYDRLRAMNKI